MNKLDWIEKRKSTREYSKKQLTMEDLEKVRQYIAPPYPIETSDKVELVYLAEGEKVAAALQGIAGYHGVMIEAPQYIAIFSEKDPIAWRTVGYLGEYILFQLFMEEIGSCWIHAGDSAKAKAALGLEKEKDLIALIALGYPLEENVIARFFQGLKANKPSPYSEGGYGNFNVDFTDEGSSYSSRENTSSFVFIEEWGKGVSLEELEDFGLAKVYYYMKNAPSWGNRQPWKFILDRNKVALAVEKNPAADDVSDNLEAGIAMYYFGVTMNEAGLSGNWNEKDSGEYIVPENYFVAGIFEVR